MPVAILGAAVAGLVGAGGAIIAGGGIAAATFFGGALTGWAAIGAAFAVGFVGSLLASGAQALLGNQQQPRELPFTAEGSARTQMIRSAVASRKYVIGETTVSGALVFAASYGTANGQTPAPGTLNRDYLALVLVMAAHESAAMNEVWLNDTLSTDPRFAAFTTIKKHLGEPTQVADPDLIAANVGWTSEHVGVGLTYLIALLRWDATAFPSGIPNIKARLRGLKFWDPRTSTRLWSNNAALTIREYLDDTDAGLATEADELHEDTFIAGANTSDEIVDITEDGRAVLTVDDANDRFTLDGEKLAVRTGDRVRIATAGSLPTGLSAGNYYVILVQTDPVEIIQLASSLANARAGTAVAISSTGSGTMTIYRNGQPRYTCDGVIDTAQAPGVVLDKLLSGSAGVLVYQQGGYALTVAASASATFALTADDLRGPLGILPSTPKRDLFNAVRGVFSNPAKGYQPDDFPAVTNTLYETEDGEQIFRDLELPFTDDPTRAQRLAKVALETSRQPAGLKWPSKIGALKVLVMDVGTVTIEQLGYDEKEFRVMAWTLAADGGIDLELREHAAEAYDWNDGDATTVDPAPQTNLPAPWTVAATAINSISETLVETRTGAGFASQVTVTWGAAVDAFVAGYDLEYRLATDTDWTPYPRTANLLVRIDDVPPGSYEFRVRVVNQQGVKSEYSDVADYEVLGLAAPPSVITGLTFSVRNGQGVLNWNKHADPDVRIGGRIRFRWSPDVVGAVWANAVDLFPGSSPSDPGGVAGSATECMVPALAGTFFARAIDSSGNLCETDAEVITTLPDLFVFNVVHTEDEHPTFGGTKTDCEVDTGLLQIVSTDGISVDVNEAVYDFDSVIDLGAVYPVRVMMDIAVTAFAQADNFDSRMGDIDDWGSFDGAADAGLITVVCELRTTEDDPAGSPTWTDWTQFLICDVVARGIQRRIKLRTSDTSVNMQIERLTTIVDVPDRVVSGNVLTSTSAAVSVTFAGGRFWQTPTPFFQIDGAATGDYIDFANLTASGVDVSCRNAAGTRIAKTVHYSMAGYGQGN